MISFGPGRLYLNNRAYPSFRIVHFYPWARGIAINRGVLVCLVLCVVLFEGWVNCIHRSNSKKDGEIHTCGHDYGVIGLVMVGAALGGRGVSSSK